MTIASEISRSEVYTGGGGVTSFQFPFRVLDAADVAVYVDDVLQTGGYTATSSGDSGTVTFATAPALGAKIVILRNTPLLQPTDIQNNTAFYAEVLEEMGDRAEMQIQQIAERVNRAVVVPPSVSGGMTTEEFKLDLTSAINSAVAAASGYMDAANEAATQASGDALAANTDAGYASGYMETTEQYKNTASGYMTSAYNAASRAVTSALAGMPIHDLASCAISGGACVIPYENGHVYSGTFPVVSSGATVSTFALEPSSNTRGGTQCTFELHLRHGGTDETAAFTNSMWYRDSNGVYGLGTSAAIAGKANTVQNLTIRTIIPNGAGAQVYLINEATVSKKED